MTRLEEDYFHSLPLTLKAVTKQLEIMNKLKAIELKMKICNDSTSASIEMVDQALEA